MAEKILNTRIALKIDTLERWNASTLPLKKGEVAFATIAATAGTELKEPVIMVKVCDEDGKTFGELPWSFHAKASDVLAACKSEKKLKEFVNGVIADAGIATDEALKTLAGRVTTAEGAITTLNGDATTAGSVAKSIADAIAALNLDTTYVKVADLATERTKLAGISEGANKVEATEKNGIIKIDDEETVVYDDKDVTDRLTALEGYFGEGDETVAKQIADAVKVEEDARKEAVQGVQDAVDALGNKVGTLPTDATATTVVGYVDEKVAAANKALEDAVDAIEEEAAKHATKTELSEGLALKANQADVAKMYTNTQIDTLVQGAKNYADANDANTEYHVEYDSTNKKIKLVAGADAKQMEIDATAFIKDGMISNVTIGDDNDLVITFNTDSGKEDIVLPLDQLVDIYTGVEGARVKVTVNSDKSISADLVAGSISKNYLDTDVQTSLGKADSALQAADIATGSANGTIAVKGTNVAVQGLGSAAYKAESDFATAAQGTLADTALQKADITTGNTNGTIKVEDTEVAVKGLGSAAYTESSAYDASGAAAAVEAKLTKLETEKVNANATAIGTINTTLGGYGDIVTHNVAEFATAEQGAAAASALQTVKVLGTTLSKDSNELTVDAAKTALNLGSAAYTEASAYATAAQGALAASALQEITTTENGGLKVTNKNQIDIDETVVFVFDCGDSGVASN